MKKHLSFILFAFIAVCLTSCEKDDEIAKSMVGRWEAQISSGITWRGQTRYDYADFEFYSSSNRFASGTGVEYDIDYSGMYYSECYFDYKVIGSTIYIDYRNDDYDVAIVDYNLSGDTFDGFFREWNSSTGEIGGTIARFTCNRINNWRWTSSWRH